MRNASQPHMTSFAENMADERLEMSATRQSGGFTISTGFVEQCSGLIKSFWAPFADSEIVLSGESLSSTPSWIAVDASAFLDIRAEIAAIEASPEGRAEMAIARKWTAEALYGKDEVSLAVLRLRCGLSQAQLAKKLNVDPSLVSRWESKGANFELSTMDRLAQALGADFAEVAVACQKLFKKSGHSKGSE